MIRWFKRIRARKSNWWVQRLRMTWKVWTGGNAILVHDILEYETEKGAARQVKLTGQTEYTIESDALSLMAASYALVPPEHYGQSQPIPPFSVN